MTQQAAGTFEVKQWDEQPYHTGEGQAKLTRASVRKTFQGDFEGESTLEYLMAYPGDGTASFVGLELMAGRLKGRSGSFILQHAGTDDGATTTGTWHVVPGSGTGVPPCRSSAGTAREARWEVIRRAMPTYWVKTSAEPSSARTVSRSSSSSTSLPERESCPSAATGSLR